MSVANTPEPVTQPGQSTPTLTNPTASGSGGEENQKSMEKSLQKENKKLRVSLIIKISVTKRAI